MERVAPKFAKVTRSSDVLQEPVEKPLSKELSRIIYELCGNLVVKYERIERNIDDFVCVLIKDKDSVVRRRHEFFIMSLVVMSLDRGIEKQTITGNIFAELLTRKVLTVASFTRVFDFILKEWHLYIREYDQLFSGFGAYIAPLIISETSSFEFINLIPNCETLDEDTSIIFFIEILKKILLCKQIQTIHEQDGGGGILWMYNKWMRSNNILLIKFIPTNHLKNFYRNNPLGVFLLSVAIYDTIQVVDNKLLYPILLSWIRTNIGASIIKCSEFMRALTIAIVMACLQSDVSLENSFNRVYVKLLTHFIQSEECLQSCDVQKRQVQCLFGIQIISAALNYPEGMIVTLFHKLYQNNIVNKESFDLWKRNDVFSTGFDEDLITKSTAIEVLDSYLSSHETNHSNEGPAK